MFSFIHTGDTTTAAAFVDALQLFGIGYSWGGFESLALPVQPEKYRSVVAWDKPGTLIRLQIGLEDTDDLIADLGQAFEVARTQR